MGMFDATDTSAFPPPNILADMASGAMLQRGQRNELALQHDQQEISSNDMEMVARFASGLTQMSEPEAAAAYGPGIAQLQAQGFAKHAPPVYPGHAAAQRLAAMGTPSATQYEYGAGRTAAQRALEIGGDGAAPGPGADATPSGPVQGTHGPGSATRAEAEGAPPAPGSPGAAVAQRQYDFWRSKGYTDAQAAGIMAGGAGSESNFNPSVMGDGGTSYGQYQHHGPRYAAMQKRFNTATPSEAQQNEYAAWEISPEGPYRKVGEALKTAQTPADAATIWTRDFGVPADKTEIGRRARGAARYAGVYGGATQQAGGAVAPGGVAARTGGVDVAGPGGAPPAAPGGPMRETQVKDASGRVQTVTVPVTPAAAPGFTDTGGGDNVVPPNAFATPAPAPVVAVAPPPLPAQQVAPPPPPPAPAPVAQAPQAPTLQLLSNGLQPRQEAQRRQELAGHVKEADVRAITTRYEALAAQNRAVNVAASQQNFERGRQVTNDAAAVAQRDLENTNRAEQLRLSQNTDKRAQEVADDKKKSAEAAAAAPEFHGDSKEMQNQHILRYGDPYSSEYGQAWGAVKAERTTVSQSGLVQRPTMSEFRPPMDKDGNPRTNLGESTIVPGPSAAGVEAARVATADHAVISSAIDNFTATFKEQGGGSFDAWIDNPTSVQAQKLNGAFDQLLTAMRRPSAMNTGVLQPAEMAMMDRKLVSPQSWRGLFATPEAMVARLGEIKKAMAVTKNVTRRLAGMEDEKQTDAPAAAAPAAQGGWSVKRID